MEEFYQPAGILRKSTDPHLGEIKLIIYCDRSFDTLGILARDVEVVKSLFGQLIRDQAESSHIQSSKSNSLDHHVVDEHSSNEEPILSHMPSGRLDKVQVFVPSDALFSVDQSQQKFHDRFLQGLKAVSEEVKVISYSIADLWTASPPEEAEKESLDEFIDYAASPDFFFDGFHEYEAFRQDYERQKARSPYVTPYMQWKW